MAKRQTSSLLQNQAPRDITSAARIVDCTEEGLWSLLQLMLDCDDNGHAVISWESEELEVLAREAEDMIARRDGGRDE